MKLYRVETSFFCAGFVSDDRDIVIEAAPILGFLLGKLTHQAYEEITKRYYLRLISISCCECELLKEV